MKFENFKLPGCRISIRIPKISNYSHSYNSSKWLRFFDAPRCTHRFSCYINIILQWRIFIWTPSSRTHHQRRNFSGSSSQSEGSETGSFPRRRNSDTQPWHIRTTWSVEQSRYVKIILILSGLLFTGILL